MRRWAGRAPLFLLQWAGPVLLLVAGPVAAQLPGAGAAQEKIGRLLDASAAAWNRGDLDGHLADNADSVSFMTSRGPIVGRARTADALRPLGEAHALVVGRFVLSGGGESERSGWFSTVWERQARGWRVIHGHSS